MLTLTEEGNEGEHVEEHKGHVLEPAVLMQEDDVDHTHDQDDAS
jgi:hypothetical protein